MKNGLIIVYTGNGKGKTSAALGGVVRTIGNKGKVAFIQFMKGNRESSERLLFETLDDIDVFTFGAGWFKNKKEKEIQVKRAVEGLSKAKEIIKSSLYDLVVLDEINYILDYGLLEINDVIKIIEQRGSADIILTGRNAKKEIIELADTVSEINEIKHAFQKKIAAKKGIDF